MMQFFHVEKVNRVRDGGRDEVVQLIQRLTTAVLLFAAAAVAASPPSIRPGQYEVVGEMAMPGNPEPMEIKNLECFTPEEAENLHALLLAQLGGQDDCTVSNLVSTSGELSFDAKCDVEGTTTNGRSESTFGNEWFKTQTTVVVDGGTISTKASARWIGATCEETED